MIGMVPTGARKDLDLAQVKPARADKQSFPDEEHHAAT
jgi:hypothetical protein